MRHFAIGLAGILVASCAGTTPPTENPTEYRLYFLGGQSNMDGFGDIADLPDSLKGGVENAYIFHGRTVADGVAGGGVGKWAALKPGHGVGFDTDGNTNRYSDTFGPELSFARQLLQASPDRPIAIIKFSRGGTGLKDGVSGYGSWDPDYDTGNRRNQYDNALSTIANGLSIRDVDGDGRDDILVPSGIIWMQGEADAFDNPSASANYAAHLARLMDLLRAAFRTDDLPVVIGRIKDSGTSPETNVMAYSEVVRQAQMAYANAHRCADIVTVTEDFKFLPDKWHYQSAEYIRLGTAFAEKVEALGADCSPSD